MMLFNHHNTTGRASVRLNIPRPGPRHEVARPTMKKGARAEREPPCPFRNSSERYGSAKTTTELWPRTAGAMDFLVTESGPAVTDWPSPVRIATYCLPSTA